MKACGIVAEYNPLHTGHVYQMNKAKQISQADCIIVVMSGNFVQRGEPAGCLCVRYAANAHPCARQLTRPSMDACTLNCIQAQCFYYAHSL